MNKMNMKNRLPLLVMTALTVLVVSCSEKLDPVEPLSDLKYQRNALLVEFEEKWMDYKPWGMTKSGNGLAGDGAELSYWWEHKAEAKDYEELWSMCDIPAEKLMAMSTQNLVRSCYIYPYNADILTFWDIDICFLDGIHNLMSRYNGYRELNLRKDAPQEMLNLFQEVKYGDWDGKSDYTVLDSKDYRKQNSVGGGISSFSMVIASAVDNKCFTEAQIIELSKYAIEKIDEVKKDKKTYSSMTVFFPYLLGAVISYHYDNTLTEEQAGSLDYFIEDCYRGPEDESSYNLIYNSLRKIAESSSSKN